MLQKINTININYILLIQVSLIQHLCYLIRRLKSNLKFHRISK